MKKLLYLAMLLVAVGCGANKAQEAESDEAESLGNDSTMYGTCGEASSMHTLELIDMNNESLLIHIDDESDTPTVILGEVLNGDRMAVTAHKDESGMYVAQRVINLSSLLGHWQSVDRDFDIAEDGEVKSYVPEATDAWTAWRILNGQLLLNADTFDIVVLTGDSLEIENGEGIYSFNRLYTNIPVEENDSTVVE